MSYHFDRIITLIIPKFYGSIENEYVGGPYYFYTEMTFYFTIIGLLLAIYGSVKNYKDKFVLSLIVSSILLLCLVILKFRLFLIFPTHPEIKPSALKNPIF
jgi:hypothetical protein